jgi:leukotriene-A4 hydrolase
MSVPAAIRLSADDPTSYANLDEAKVVDIFLKLDVDFDKHVLAGTVTLTVEKVKADAARLVLDSSDLKIHSATEESTGRALDFTVADPGFVGSKVVVKLPTTTDKTVKITIEYSTSNNASALQWLSPAQTAGKTHPYLFSQCQAIHCRSMVPLQDTPAVKSTYSAEITAPAELTVLMSAVRQGEPESVADGKKRLHRFTQKIPIQSYLIAIAAGKLESRKIGPRSHVWSEKEFIDASAYEFEDTELMLKSAEELCGPYVWGTYDILVLPPSFPYGGMENPCLTFSTPTLLAGDKSLANVIAHEIAHSWSGNLVTNKNFEHFWLNEGFTVFTERKITGRLEGGEPMRHFSAIGGWNDLSEAINDVLGKDNKLTALVLDLTGVDPDDAFSIVPYEKGSAFLWYLEDTVGGPTKMEPFLRSYYDHFKYKSIDSYEFKAFFLDYFKSETIVTSIDWEGWFNNPGMPPYKPKYDDSLARACYELKDKWVKWNEQGPAPDNVGDWNKLTSGQKVEFLGVLLAEEKPLSIKKLEKMEELYKLNSVINAEIRCRWIRLGLAGHWKDAIPRAVKMVTDQGRMKFLRPIYRDLYKWEESREAALEIFEKNRGSMMKVAIQGLEKDLKLK